VLVYKADSPIAVLRFPVELRRKAFCPIARLEFPYSLLSKALGPIAVLEPPVVLSSKAEFPIAVLPVPVVLIDKAELPIAVFVPPVAEELKFVVEPIEMFEGTLFLPVLKNKPLIVPFEPDVEIEPVTPKEPVIRVDPVIWTVCWSGFTNEAVEAKLELIAFCTNEAVEAKLELKAYEELTEKDEVVENDAVPNKEPVIIAVLPDTFIASALKVPNLTESSDETCSIGKPDISFTENKEPERLSVTENSCPWDPWISRIVDPDPLMIRPFFILNSFAIILLTFHFSRLYINKYVKYFFISQSGF